MIDGLPLYHPPGFVVHVTSWPYKAVKLVPGPFASRMNTAYNDLHQSKSLPSVSEEVQILEMHESIG